MIRLIYGLRRPHRVTFENFVEHWIQHHAPRFGVPLRTIRRYVLYESVSAAPTLSALGGSDPYDGFASIWVDDVSSLRLLMDAAMPEASQDEILFIDHERSAAYVVEDQVLQEPEHPSPIVLIRALSPHGDLTPSDFLETWASAEDVDSVLLDAMVNGLLQGRVRSVVQEAEGATQHFDNLGRSKSVVSGFDSYYFHSAVAANTFLARYGPELAAREAGFVDLQHTSPTLLRRHVLRSPVR